MKYPWIDQYLLDKPGVTKDFKQEWKEILSIYQFVTREEGSYE